MNVNPELYDRTNRLQERDGLELLKRIRDHQRDGLVPSNVKTVIDIGCGTGNITDRIEEYVSLQKTIGIDKSDDMIAYARTNHMAGTSISYFTADICSIEASSGLMLEADSADIVLSIHCLHWIAEENQSRAMANIRNLLTPGGMCYLLLFSWSDMLPLQEQLVYHPRWRKYFKEVIEEGDRNANHLEVGKDSERRRRRSSAPFPTFEPPPPEQRIHVWEQRCSDLFFEDIHVSLHSVSFDFGDWPSFQEELKSICHFLPYIPQEEQNLFLEDYYEHVKNTYTGRSAENESPVLKYEYLLIQARRGQPH